MAKIGDRRAPLADTGDHSPIGDDELVDMVGEDSFPASDPPPFWAHRASPRSDRPAPAPDRRPPQQG